MSGHSHDDDGFQRTLRRTLDDWRPPDGVPTEAMWRAIEGARAPRHHPGARRGRPLAWGLAAAALAAVAFGLGRLTAPGAGGDGFSAEPVGGGAVASRALPGPWAMSAADHLREAESLLMLFRTEEDGSFQGRTARWASSLLGTTRLLMDSPAATDPRMAEALGDLELVLVQIANLGPGTSDDERRWVEASLEEHQVLTKIRAAAEDGELPLMVED